MKYDDGSYHLDSASSEAHAAAHIGLYFRWCLVSGLVSDEHTGEPELAPLLDSVRTGEMTATEYLWETTSGKFTDVDLTEEGNGFSKRYYSKAYLTDLKSVAALDDYQFTEDQVDFEKLRILLDSRYEKWQESAAGKPWWRFWA